MSSHLEREWQLIEGRMRREAGAGGDRLAACRRFLKSGMLRTRQEHRCGVAGRTVARERSQIIDILLRHLWADTGKENGSRPGGVAIMATGGYGRGELNPFSDVDIMFLHEPMSAAEEKALHVSIEAVLYLLWDLGLKVGHSTRTIAQALAHGNEDGESKTALIEARLVAGDAALAEALRDEFPRKCMRGKEADFIRWRLEDQAERHRKYGSTVFMQEPHIKEGCGGLRDYHNLLWMAFAWKGLRNTRQLADEGLLTGGERNQVERAVDFLMRARNEMHFLAERANDQLTLPTQGRVATGLGYDQRPPYRRVEAFMKDYFTAAQDIFFLTNACARRMAQSGVAKKRGWFPFLSAGPGKAEKTDGFVISGGEINADNQAVFGEDPARLLRVFLLAQRRNLGIGFDLLRLIRRRLKMVDRRYLGLKTTREMFLEILRHKGQVGRILRLMHGCGLLGKLVPEFAPLTFLVQHEFFHRYSADEHTLVCLEELDKLMWLEDPAGRLARYQELMRAVEHPEVLHLAMLLHDTGKGASKRDHAEMSAFLAVRVAKRLRLPPEQLKLLAFLTDHHLTLSQTARRRNVDDADTIREFARIAEDPLRLDHLMLLTYADGRGVTGGGGWSDWKETLIWQLYDETRLFLAGSPEFERKAAERVGRLRGEVEELVSREISGEEIDAHFRMMSGRYLQIMDARQIAHHLRAIRAFLASMEAGGNPLEPVVSWEHRGDRGHSLMTLVTWNREQVFSRAAGAISVGELDILRADIFTRADDIVVDTFWACTDRSEAVTDPRDQKAVERVLRAAFAEADYDFEPELARIRTKRRFDKWSGDDFPTRLTLDNDSLKDYTLVEIETPDRLALLHDIVLNLTAEGAQIMFARIETEKGAAIDTFYLVGPDGGKITDPGLLDRIKGRILDTTDGELARLAKKSGM